MPDGLPKPLVLQGLRFFYLRHRLGGGGADAMLKAAYFVITRGDYDV